MSIPNLFGSDCIAFNFASNFWMAYVAILVEEGGTSVPRMLKNDYESLRYHNLAMLFLILAKAFLIARPRSGHAFSKSLRVIVRDG